MSYLCPLCQQPLVLNVRTYQCAQQHQFDLSKEGYVNLLPVQHKRSKEPGDCKEMMLARRAFLDADHYKPMRDAVSEILHQHVSDKPDTQLLDIGCGEGYYTGHFAKALENTRIFGLDISKAMIRAAAKRYKRCHFLVASSQRLPFSDNQLNAVVRIYAPCLPQELARTIKDQGLMITVTPGPRHLYQLKAEIYDEVRLHDIPVEDLAGFELALETSVAYPMSLNAQEATRLLQMTPFAWRASQALWDKLNIIDTFVCEADFTLRVYRKHPSKKDVFNENISVTP